MAVDAVQNNKYNKMNYIGAMAIGAISGYSLKWVIPVTTQEKDENYSAELSVIREKTKKARNAEIEAIKKEASNIPYSDEFIRMNEKGERIYSKITKLKGSKQEALMTLLERVNDAAIEFKEKAQKELKIKTKNLRPTGTFIAIGVFVGLSIAAIHNIISIKPKNKNED